MPAAEDISAFSPAELDRLFAPFLDHPIVLLAVSGGPDSTALMLLAHRWRTTRRKGPKLLVATVDHALRAASAEEPKAVAALCRKLKLPHETLVWPGEKPPSGLQEAARAARYGLLEAHARETGASAIALAHTLDDQAETVLFRLMRGSGLIGLCAMRQSSLHGEIVLLRPFLEIPKVRLVATVEAAGVPYAVDPSNTDPRFTRPRLRRLAPTLAAEGLDARRLATLARRVARAEAALAKQAEAAWARCVREEGEGSVRLDASAIAAEPEEISLRLLLRALAACASEGEPELAKAERLHESLMAALRAGEGFSRTLAGALVRLKGAELTVRQAPVRRRKAIHSQQIHPDGDTRPWQARARHLD